MSSSVGTKAPSQGEDGNFRLSIRFLEHYSATLSPIHQKKVTHPAALTPNFAFRHFPPQKNTGEFRFLSTSHLSSSLGPAINLSVLKKKFKFCICKILGIFHRLPQNSFSIFTPYLACLETSHGYMKKAESLQKKQLCK